MNTFGISDLANSFRAKRQNATLRTEISQLTLELSSGQKGDISKVTRGQLSPLSSIERSLALNVAYSNTANRTSLKLEVASDAFSKIASDIAGLGESLIEAANRSEQQRNLIVTAAEDKLSSVASALSTQVADEYIFSGLSTNTAPLANVSDILSELSIATSGATSAIEFRNIISDWFNDPTGFETTGYQGSDASRTALKVSSTQTFRFDLTANSDEVKAVLIDLASVALMSRGAFNGSEDEKATLSRITGEGLLAGNDRIISIQAKIGKYQSAIDNAKTENSLEDFALSKAKNDLVSVDMFDTITRLEDLQIQLESFYLTTSKMSRLNLAEYLR